MPSLEDNLQLNFLNLISISFEVCPFEVCQKKVKESENRNEMDPGNIFIQIVKFFVLTKKTLILIS